MATTKRLKITLMHSINRRIDRHKACVKGLGLRRLYHSVELIDTPSIRGMIAKVSYLLKVEEINHAS